MELKIKDDRDEDLKEMRKSISEILSRNLVLSMGTVDGEEPHINTAFYAFTDDIELFILTPPHTRHGQNLEENSSVAVDIHESDQHWTDKKQGLQISGTAVKADDVSRAFEVYSKRCPELENIASDVEELREIDAEFYRIEPEEIKIFDEERFEKDPWVKLEVRRD